MKLSTIINPNEKRVAITPEVTSKYIKLGFDVVNSSVILCDRPEIDLRKLSLASLRFTNEAGEVSYISTSRTSGGAYWYKAEKNKIYIYGAGTDNLVPITGHLDYVNMLDSNSPCYGQENGFILNSSTFQFSYACDAFSDRLQLVIGKDRYDLSLITTGYYLKRDRDSFFESQYVIYSRETDLPVEVTGFLHVDNALIPNSKYHNTALGSRSSNEIYQKGISFTRVGDSKSYEVIGEGLVGDTRSYKILGDGAKTYSTVKGFVQIDLGRYEPSFVTLEEGERPSIAINAGEQIRFKVPASKSTTPYLFLIVESVDGTPLPAVTWKWVNESKDSRFVQDGKKDSYVVDISDAMIVDDFVYVYLHTSEACQFVITPYVW